VHVFYVFLSLTLSHKKSSLRDSVAQTADGNKQGAEIHGHLYHLVVLIPVAERGFPQAIPVGNFSVGWLCDWFSFGVSCGLLLCFVALFPSAVYHLTVEQLRQTCVERGLNSNGQARTLRRRLADQVKSESMERPEQQEVTQASDPTDLLRSAAGNITP